MYNRGFKPSPPLSLSLHNKAKTFLEPVCGTVYKLDKLGNFISVITLILSNIVSILEDLSAGESGQRESVHL